MSEKKILVVEDDATVRDLCVVILKSHRLDSIIATNGKEGIHVYEERHGEISLVLSDVVMPIMNGIEMTRTIFHLDPRAKVILMSAYNIGGILPEDLRRVCAVIEKPFTADRLVHAVTCCLPGAGDQN